MGRKAAFTHVDKLAMLARGEPWIVHPVEAAKGNAAYQTDAEILLACILVSGTLDTAIVLRAMQQQHHSPPMTDEGRGAYQSFYRVWAGPTPEERSAVLAWAEKIAGRQRDFRWTPPV